MFLLHLGSGSSTVPRWEAVVYSDLLTVPPARTEHTATVVPLVEQTGAPLGMITFGGMDGNSRAPAWSKRLPGQRPSSAPVPPQGAPGGSGQLGPSRRRLAL